jgi:Ca-activated chloride channel family protein
MDVRLDYPGYLHLLWVVIALGGLAWYGFAMKDRALRVFASANVLGSLVGGVSRWRQAAKAALLLGALACVAAALAGPRWGAYWEELPRRGIDLMICLDVSRSMLARDVPPNRLERAKQDIRDVVSSLRGDRVGLIAFAGAASLKCPLTIDYGFFRMALDDLTVGSVARGGTNLGDAVRLAAESLDDGGGTVPRAARPAGKAILLISDGEDTAESFPVEAASRVFREQGIRVYTVGLGDASQGARVPLEKGEGREERGEPTGYLEYEGEQVWSRMNPETLRAMALAGGGAYVPAGTQAIELDRIYSEKIAMLEQREYETRKVERQRARFQIFAGLALVMMFIEMFTREVRVQRGPRSVKRGWGVARAAAVVLMMVAPAAAEEELSAAEWVAQGNAVLAEGRYEEALEAYRAASSEWRAASDKEAARVSYNKGVALYRLGRFDEARGAFEDALRTTGRRPVPREVEARAKYNLGNCAYSTALEKSDRAPEAIEDLRRAMTYYRDALELAPADREARENIELAQRLIEWFEEQDAKRQAEQEQSSEEGESGEEDAKSQAGEDAAGEEGDSVEDEEEAKRQAGDERSGEDGDSFEADAKRQAGEDDSGEEREFAPREMVEEKEMTREQAERILQEIRDKERARREEQRRREMMYGKRMPVERDW